MRNVLENLLRIGLFLMVFICWMWVLVQPFPSFVDMAVIIGGIALIFPMVWLARLMLEHDPTPRSAEWLTTFLHAVLMAIFGSAFIRAGLTYEAWRLWVIPIPAAVGMTLAIFAGALAALAVLNLALRGWGAPFGIALSRRLAVDWLYAWTRNPMVLATLPTLLAIGLWIQSAGFVLWILLLVAPALLFFVKVFEERELAIRFGQGYLDYKRRTPMLIPRRPAPRASQPARRKPAPKKASRRKRPPARPARKSGRG